MYFLSISKFRINNILYPVVFVYSLNMSYLVAAEHHESYAVALPTDTNSVSAYFSRDAW
jgi:hypothetical protein